jgi:hypothetical protein
LAGYRPKNSPTAVENSVAMRIISKPKEGEIWALLAAAICPTAKAMA